MVDVLDLKTQHCSAWRKSLGLEADGETDWFISVLQGETSLEDWSFEPVRKLGQVKPSTCLKMSEGRKGANNPTMKCKTFDFSKDEVFDFGKQVFWEIDKDETRNFSDIHKVINAKFPNYLYMISDDYHKAKKRYQGRYATIIGLCTGISPTEVESLLVKRRGKKISVGQRASEKCISTASEMASRLVSTWRISIPHKKLYSMVLEYDSQATMEYRVKTPTRSFSFDIHSPQINSLIEMHGRIWHDLEAAPEKLKPLVVKNEANDKVKQGLATAMGMRYIVFWDDQQDRWAGALKELYGNVGQEAQGQVGEVSG